MKANIVQLELIIIGAGPAGISLAAEAISSGIDSAKILVIEKAPEHSWSIRKFYPDKKLVTANFKGKEALCNGVMCIPDLSKIETLSYLDQAIVNNNVKVNYSETVLLISKNSKGIFEIESNKGTYLSATCVIAIGIFGKPNKPSFKIPNELKSKISFDVTSKELHQLKVLVIGGGDSASEYTQYLVQNNNNLFLSYRKDKFTRMNTINFKSLNDLVKTSKAQLLLNTNVKEIIEEERSELKNEAQSSQIRVKFEEAIDDIIVDHIVCALGGTTPTNFLKILKIDFVGKDPTIKDGYETSIPGLFLIGDLGAGKRGGSIISAFNSSYEAMKTICDNYLECKIKE